MASNITSFVLCCYVILGWQSCITGIFSIQDYNHLHWSKMALTREFSPKIYNSISVFIVLMEFLFENMQKDTSHYNHMSLMLLFKNYHNEENRKRDNRHGNNNSDIRDGLNQILNVKTSYSNGNVIHIAIRLNKTCILQVLCHCCSIAMNGNSGNIINRKKITSFKHFNKDIFDIHKAYNIAKKCKSREMLQVLTLLIKHNEKNDFEIIESLFDAANNASTNGAKKEIEIKKIELKNSDMCELFVDHVKKNIQFGNNECELIMNCLRLNIINLLIDRESISDDSLLLLWKYCIDKFKYNNNNNYDPNKDGTIIILFVKLLKCLKDNVHLCLIHDNICKSCDYLYFEQYLLDSNVSFEKIANNDGIIHIIASQDSVNDVSSSQPPSQLQVSGHSDNYVAAKI